MRIKVTLTAERERTSLPLEYNVPVASLIYATLASGSKEFASRLHDVGFRANGRRYKLFTFSRIQTRQAVRQEENLILVDPEIELQIGSPVVPLIEHLVNGFSRQQSLGIGGSRFHVSRSEFVPTPRFEERMIFRALSRDGQLRKRTEACNFLSLEDDWSPIIRENLLGKYEALHGRSAHDQRLVWTWDEPSIVKAAEQGKRLSALRDIHGTKIRGWLTPFIVEGSRELIEIGYEAGFGARNSMGFGMAEAHRFE